MTEIARIDGAASDPATTTPDTTTRGGEVMPDIDPAGIPEPFFTDPRSLPEKLASRQAKWIPHDDEQGCPALLCGLVLDRGWYESSYGGGSIPTLSVLDQDGTVWSVIAFHGWLAGALKKKKPREFDFVAISFQGLGRPKKGENPPYLYSLEVVRNPDRPVEPADDREWESRLGNEPSFNDDDEASASW
jgi:hypothetical protein